MFENLISFFTGGSRGAEDRLTKRLHLRAQALRSSSPFYHPEALQQFASDIVALVCEELETMLSEPLILFLHDTIIRLLYEDRFIIAFDDSPNQLELMEDIRSLSLRDGSRLREILRRNIHLIENHRRLLPIWKTRVVILLSGLLRNLPLSAFADLSEDGTLDAPGITLPEARVYDLYEDLPDNIHRAMGTMFADEIEDADLFNPLREKLLANVDEASNIAPQERYSTKKERVMPPDFPAESSVELVETYLKDTSLLPIFYAHVPFSIPFPARFEHTHVIGGTGHGKTQLLQYLITADIDKARYDDRAIVVIDSQGDLIRAVSKLRVFGKGGDLSGRLVLIDPTDVDYPVALNMFDFGHRAGLKSSPRKQELLLNASVEAYEYFFGALLGAELTQRQGVMFRFLARLLLEIPNATIHTLRDLMEHGERYRTYMERLPHTARGFFETRFFDRSFSETKKQILARLWGVLSNVTLERMFSHTENKVDLGRMMKAGKIVLVNTAKDFLGHEGASLFGRFIITMLTQATLQRAALPSVERNPCFVYIDEAADYIDENIGRLLTQARKQRVGLTLAHQNLDQLPPDLRSVLMANTTIKFAGGVSSKDANTLDGEFRVTAKFLLAQRKQKAYSEFACFVKNETRNALSLRVPLGVLESERRMGPKAHRLMIAANRARYSAPPEYPLREDTAIREVAPERSKQKVRRAARPEDPDSALVGVVTQEEVIAPHAPVASTPVEVEAKHSPRRVAIVPPVPRNPHGGGQKHRYLQELIKTLGEERGFRAQVEEGIEGGGRIDVILSRDKRRIACEISVTTNRDHELLNVEKCLSAGFEEVLVVSHNERHLKSLATFIGRALSEKQRPKVTYLLPEQMVPLLDGGEIPAPAESKVVRGYKVKVVSENSDEDIRRAAIVEVMTRTASGT